MYSQLGTIENDRTTGDSQKAGAPDKWQETEFKIKQPF